MRWLCQLILNELTSPDVDDLPVPNLVPNFLNTVHFECSDFCHIPLFVRLCTQVNTGTPISSESDSAALAPLQSQTH